MKINSKRTLVEKAIQRTWPEKAVAVLINPSLLIGRVMRSLPFLPFTMRMYFDGFKKPGYAYGLYRAAFLAAALGMPEISALEFGVAQGTGFRELQSIAKEIERIFPVKIHVVGFDMGSGLPPVVDYRDIPYYWKTGDFTLEGKKIDGVIYGDVADTVKEFKGPPVGFISFDLDVYTSTKNSFVVFQKEHLPRVYCYFDDTSGVLTDLNDYLGELLAIHEFNQENKAKIAPMNGFQEGWFTKGLWTKGMYAYHDFHHPEYNTYILGS